MKNTFRLLTLVALATSGAAFGALGTACSSDSTTTDGGTATTSTATTTTTTTTTSTATATGTGSTPTVPELNGCKTYVDKTADAAIREITWDFPVSSTPEACMKIKAGQTVTWKGNLGSHPLSSKGGDTPNPITNTAQTKFDKAGSFGYVCTLHANMLGAVLVVP